MLVAALTTNLATRAIWVPFMHVIYCLTQESSKCVSLLNAKKKKMFFIRFILTKLDVTISFAIFFFTNLKKLIFQLIWLNAILGLGRYSFLCDLAYYMAKDCAATHMAFCMSILSFVWMLDATESLDAILDTWAK